MAERSPGPDGIPALAPGSEASAGRGWGRLGVLLALLAAGCPGAPAPTPSETPAVRTATRAPKPAASGHALPKHSAAPPASPEPSEAATPEASPSVVFVEGVTVDSLAGRGDRGFGNDVAAKASFSGPSGVAVDDAGVVYVADRGNHVIRAIAPDGMVTTLAGAGQAGSLDGTGATASFDAPVGLVVLPGGPLLVADANGNRLRAVDLKGTDHAVSTLAGTDSGHDDGKGIAASFFGPTGLALAPGGVVYVADAGNHLLRAVAADGAVTTLVGGSTSGRADGVGSAARFSAPHGLALDRAGNLYVADTGNNSVRRVALQGAGGPQVTTLVGASGAKGTTDGPADTARLNAPEGILVDAGGDLYVADTGNNRIRKIAMADPSHPVVSTVAGTGRAAFANGTGASASFSNPVALAPGPNGALLVADQGNDRVRRLLLPGGLPSADPIATSSTVPSSDPSAVPSAAPSVAPSAP